MSGGSLLPNAMLAYVADAKVRDYLLEPTHPDNQGKALFFQGFGFTQQRWTTLRDALRRHPIANPVVRLTPNAYGVRYRVKCSLPSPDGRNPCIATIWVIDPASRAPQFITAVPRP